MIPPQCGIDTIGARPITLPLLITAMLHVLTPTSRVVSFGVAAAWLLVVWLGVKLTYG